MPPPESVRRESRNCTPPGSACTRIFERFSPVFLSSQVSIRSDPSTWIELPLRKNWQQFSAWRSQTVTSMKSDSSRRSPSRPDHLRVVARRSSVTAIPLGVRRSSGSKVSQPMRNTLFKSAIASTLPSNPRQHRVPSPYAVAPRTTASAVDLVAPVGFGPVA